MPEPRVRPNVWDYLPPSPSSHWMRPDPITQLPGGDELAAELTEAIDARLASGERHTHPKKGGCPTCAAAAAETVVRYLERNTRVIESETLAPEVLGRARKAVKAMPYLASRHHLRLSGELGADPTCPTVDDLLVDLETIGAALRIVRDQDDKREHELRIYREWRQAVEGLASSIVEQIEQLDPLSDENDPLAKPVCQHRSDDYRPCEVCGG